MLLVISFYMFSFSKEGKAFKICNYYIYHLAVGDNFCMQTSILTFSCIKY